MYRPSSSREGRLEAGVVGSQVEFTGEIPRLLQIDGLVAAVLVELGAPYFVRALVLGWTEADERPETHVEITHGF